MADWKEQFDKATSRMKDNAKEKLDDKIDLQKEKLKHSTAGQLAQQKGLKNKAKFLGNRAANRLKNTQFADRLRKMAKGAKAVANFISANIIPIAIITGIVTVGSNLAIMGVGLGQSLGNSPHYYCELDPPSSVRNSKEYRQYCMNNSSYITFEGVNGHYVVQDGPGPCASCSTLNLLVRFFYANDVNIYDYMWLADGQYGPTSGSIVTNNSAENTLRLYVTGAWGANNSNDWAAKKGVANGSIEFAENHGKKDYTMANWGYLRDPTVNGSDGYSELAGNDNWVWDLSLENDGEGSDWSAQWYTGNNISIEGVKATFIHGEVGDMTLAQFKSLLEAHPAGIAIYRQYNTSGAKHAILVTGYDSSTDTFMVVDPALGTMGGYEHSADTCATSGGTPIFSNSIIKSLDFSSYTYIDEG